MAILNPDSLPSLDLVAMPALFGDTAAQVRNQKAQLAGDRRHQRRVESRRYVRMTQLGRAVDHLGQLPAPGESIHLVLSGRYDAWQILEAIMALAAPATARSLTAATLGFSRRHADELFRLIDAGTVAACQMIVSHYFRSADQGVFEHLHAGLTNRGQQCYVLRSHAKLLLVELTDGRNIVVETSANLRSSQNVEQATIADDAGLLQFHRQWIADLIDETNKQEGHQ